MRKMIFFLSALLMSIAAGLYYTYLYPPAIYKRAAQRILDSLSEAANMQDRNRLSLALQNSLTDTAKITLEIGFPAMPGQQMRDVSAERFEKQDFIHFIDNTLFTLQHYRMKSTATSLSLSRDKKTGTLVFTSKADADGMQMDGNVHFQVDGLCSANLSFTNLQLIQMSELSCVMQLHEGMEEVK